MYIHPSGIMITNINDNLVFQRVEHKVYEISPFTIVSTRVPIYPDYGTMPGNTMYGWRLLCVNCIVTVTPIDMSTRWKHPGLDMWTRFRQGIE
jgi:hypothetical protein